MTFAQLFEIVEKYNIDWNSEIYYQRVPDVYFTDYNWSTYSIFVKGQMYHEQLEMNKKVDNGEFSNKEQYPLITDPARYKMSDEEMEKLKEEYIDVASVGFYPEHPDIIFLTAHI